MGNRDNYSYGKSQYLKASDLVGKTVNVIVEAVDDVEFEKGLKPVLSFKGKEKKLVVNATNFDCFADAFGGFTEAWIDKTITLAGEKITVKGVRTDTIKVRIPPQQKQQQTSAAAAATGDDAEAPF